jgi:hypothetical protein
VSQRGVGKSSELSPDEMSGNVPPRKLYDLHVLDIQNLVQYMRNELKISRLTILVWSASCSAILGLFTLEHLPVTQTFFPFVERIVIWEPPTPVVLDMPRTATGIAHRVIGEFPAHVALFISNPPDYLADRIVGKYTQVFPSEGSTLNDPDYPSWSKSTMDLHSWPANFRALISNDRVEMKDKVREACHNLAHANVRKGVLYGTKALPDCIEGCWVVRDWIEEVGGHCAVFRYPLRWALTLDHRHGGSKPFCPIP